MHTEMKYRFLIHYTLSFIGGYLGLYAIVSRADLFGNAQTANLIGVVRDLIGRNFSDMLLRVGALLIYMAAVILTVWIPEHFSADLRFISIGIDIFAILLLGFFPSGMSPVVALYPVFFAMPFQWCTFKAPGGYNSSTIFSTNNLRQFTTAVTQFLMKKDSAQCDKILRNDAAFFSYRCSFVSDPVYDLRSLRRMALSGSCLLCCMADQCRPEYRSRYTGSYPKHSF